MNKYSFTISGLILFASLMMAGCATVKTKEDLLKKAQKIKIQAQEKAKEETKGQKPIKPAAIQMPEFERLTYHANYLGINVGTMVVTNHGVSEINGRPAYKFELVARTNKFFSKMFKVEDRFVSYMDADNHYVLRHEEYRREGKYKKDAIVNFDHGKGKAYYEHLLNGSKETIDIPVNVQDVMTANYYVRLKSWGIGDTLDLKVYVDEEIYDLVGLIKGATRLRLGKLGKQDAFIFEPYAMQDGKSVKKGRALGYYKKDQYKTPLKGMVKTPIFGSATIKLISVEYKK